MVTSKPKNKSIMSIKFFIYQERCKQYRMILAMRMKETLWNNVCECYVQLASEWVTESSKTKLLGFRSGSSLMITSGSRTADSAWGFLLLWWMKVKDEWPAFVCQSSSMLRSVKCGICWGSVWCFRHWKGGFNARNQSGIQKACQRVVRDTCLPLSFSTCLETRL